MSEARALNPAEEMEREFRCLLEQVRQGSEEAAWRLIDEYGSHILRVVRRSLHETLRTKFDSGDFLQSVWASFFTRRSKIIGFQTSQELIGFLATLARNKVVDEHRRRRTLQYNVRREVSLDDRTKVLKEELAGQEATPSQTAMARERWQRFLADQPEALRRAISLRFRGETYAAIAQAVGLHERTVREFFKNLFEE